MDVRKRRWKVISRVLAVTMIAGAVLLTPVTSQSANRPVKAKFKTYDPKVKYVSKGSKVKWKNVSGRDHSVVAYSDNWNLNQALYKGNEFSYEFTKKGVYKYSCYYHSEVVDGVCEGMCGKVKVN